MKVSRLVTMSSISVILAALFFAAGCVKLPPPDPNNPIKTVAILPFTNSTSDMDGPNWMRVAFSKFVPSRYYLTVANEKVDQQLKNDLNITLAGQLDYMNPGVGAPSPEKVGKLLAVDGLFYCNLDDFQNMITGFYNKRKVKAKCRLVNAQTGETVWEKVEEQSNTELQLSVKGAIDAAKQKAAGAVLNKVFRANPLQQQTNTVAIKLRNTIPSGPVAPAK
jgi:hypothetical protein